MKRLTQDHILQASCLLTLAALGMMVWSLLDPRPAPVVAAMSIGQALGTLSLAAFVYVVVSDLRAQLARARAARNSSRPP